MEYQILSKDEYERISFVEFNRDIDQPHVEALAESINNYGFIAPAIAMEIDGRIAVVDGQHRVMAAMGLNIDIPFYIISNISEDRLPGVIAMLNTTSKRWKLPDYYRLYVRMKKEHYVWISEFMKKTNLSLHYAIALWRYDPLKQVVDMKGDYKIFKSGDWKPDSQYQERFNKFLESFYAVKGEVVSEATRHSMTFSDALMMVILHPKLNYKRLAENLKSYGYQGVLFSSVQNHFDALTMIYNKSGGAKLTFDYQICIDGSVATSDKERKAVREKYVDMNQFAEMSPYNVSSVKTNKKLQPNGGKPDLRRKNKKYWTMRSASTCAGKQIASQDA